MEGTALGIFKFFKRNGKSAERIDSANDSGNIARRCHFERMEPRQVLSVNPVVAGITYLETDGGEDRAPDYFEVTFRGGSTTTQMTQFVINGDQDGNSVRSQGDMIFHVGPGITGAAESHPFQYVAGRSIGVNASDVLGVQVSEDGLRLTVTVRNFVAGDRMAFSLDVDEIETPRIDKIASGVEFEGTLFTAQFSDPHFNFNTLPVSISTRLQDGQQQTQTGGLFFDEYDNLLARGEQISGGSLDLIRDNQQGNMNRNDAAVDAYTLVPKPIEISGKVYHDEDADCVKDSNEQGIANVNITLQKFNEGTQSYETVATTKTDANGNYRFGTDLGLQPGKFRIVESQPADYLSVGAKTGSVAGNPAGTVTSRDVLSEINVPLGGTVAESYDFCEIRPASLSGHVWHDRNDDGNMDSGEERIANVLIKVTRTGAKPGSAIDPFADTAPIFVRTDANGHWSVDGLPPGVYQAIEINSYPDGPNPLAGYVDGKDSVGRVNGRSIGDKTNDQFNGILLCAGEDGIEYNFGELRPASISGYVSVATPEGDCLDPSNPAYRGISGVQMQLFDSSGRLVASTTTAANGFYEFINLAPGTYSVVEVQPNGYLDGADSVGRVNNVQNGANPANDRLAGIRVGSGESGVRYDFCEHIPAELCGHVWHDTNDNGVRENGEAGIAGVTIQLFDRQGNVIAEQVTDANGRYCFKDLYAGEYKIREVQPAAYADGKDSLGRIGTKVTGEVENDAFCFINLLGGEKGDNFDFGEILLGSISGKVHADTGPDCDFNVSEGDKLLAGVTLQLLDSNGNVVSTTTTNANGQYTFGNLRPGTYSVRQVQPDGYIDGDEIVGTVKGRQVGSFENDLLKGITIASGDAAVNYDFCEHIPAQIKGNVWFDRNNDGVINNGEKGIADVTVRLFDQNNNLVAETQTDADGAYCFLNLIGGEYTIREVQPTDYVDGKDSVGSVSGSTVGEKTNDVFTKVVVRGGQKGIEYNFGEIRLSSIEGFVHADADGDCVFDTNKGDSPIANVTMQLLDGNGQVIASTLTDSNGHYSFGNLLPGQYSVRQIQPGKYFTSGEKVGSGSGTTSTNEIRGINIEGGERLVQYNFCEEIPAEIHGRVWEDGPAFENEEGRVPEGYRELRDGVFTSGLDTPLPGTIMELWYYIDPVTEEIAPRRVTLGEVLNIDGNYDHLGSNANSPVWVMTGADGQYSFRGLKAGSFIVLQQQPTGYVDANEIVGSTTGFSFNSASQAAQAPQSVLSLFSQTQIMDSLVNVRVNAGGISIQNNFTEVRAVPVGDPSPLGPPALPPSYGNPFTPLPPQGFGPGLAGHQAANFTAYIGGGRGIAIDAAQPGYTWHLSIINGGQPRGGDNESGAQWLQAGYLSDSDWSRFDMLAGEWTFAEMKADGTIEQLDERDYFGMPDGIPVSGDWNGDGVDQIGIFKGGYWLLDVNGDGKWDADDLMLRLGEEGDRPVTGDWDGDAKDDIGIYGPMWEGDPEAIEQDPGIPDPDNRAGTRPKNVPPRIVEATDGSRVMRLSSFGNSRADVIDHVFGYGEEDDVPVTGDWNGDGIRTIGVFRGGAWHVDMNADGVLDSADLRISFGQAGDIPLVGDFNGDGIEEIAVFRNGSWIIDTNGNHEIDAADIVFELGERGDLPVVGDWNNDGTDDPAVYRTHSSQANVQ
jgi:serine-aspartate repeat-containing protein C/D/E